MILDFIQRNLIAVIIMAVFGVIETSILLFFAISFIVHVAGELCEWIGELTIRDIEEITGEAQESTSILSKSPAFECAGPDANALCATCGHQMLMHSAFLHKCPDKFGWMGTNFKNATKKQYDLYAENGHPKDFERNIKLRVGSPENVILLPEEVDMIVCYRDQWEEAGNQ